MKLIFCPKCHDVFRLSLKRRYCSCLQSYGEYINSIRAKIGGEAIPIGIANLSFAEALVIQKNRDIKNERQENGVEFIAFTIPKNAPTIKRH